VDGVTDGQRRSSAEQLVHYQPSAIASGCVQRSQPLGVGRVQRRAEDIQAQADRPQVALLGGHDQRRLVVAFLQRRDRQTPDLLLVAA
jgi:hypothetical protein